MLQLVFCGLIVTIFFILIIIAPKGLIKKIIKQADEDSDFFSLLVVAGSILGIGILLLSVLISQI